MLRRRKKKPAIEMIMAGEGEVSRSHRESPASPVAVVVTMDREEGAWNDEIAMSFDDPDTAPRVGQRVRLTLEVI